jgi:hypothetical protein
LRFGDDLCPSSPKADVKNALPVGAVETGRAEIDAGEAIVQAFIEFHFIKVFTGRCGHL